MDKSTHFIPSEVEEKTDNFYDNLPNLFNFSDDNEDFIRYEQLHTVPFFEK